ncbi:hypothetical protein ACSVH2_07955 [Flavobacterium sp. RSB2_4_14]|uniref:hypothetical protein n=1 Tax=Flavobacterium sp. RSB2_4_14 TaxID=3447665 RepID=UPI003F3174CC
MIKRSLALAFLLLYLFSTTEFHELLRLPAVFEHFDSHKKETPTISLWEFLCIHYAHGEVQDDDYDNDMKLPFKTHDGCNSQNFVSLIPEQKYSLAKINPSISRKHTHKYQAEFTISIYLNTIWQPPKLC